MPSEDPICDNCGLRKSGHIALVYNDWEACQQKLAQEERNNQLEAAREARQR